MGNNKVVVLWYYLLGWKFTLVTDLKWMSAAKVSHWFLEFQNFNFTVEHISDRAHGNEDALSRTDVGWFIGAPSSCQEMVVVVVKEQNNTAGGAPDPG